MGMPESEVSRLFDAHFRGSNSTPVSGSGYGLFLVKQAVEAQGGSVHASSQPGRGMSITFTLPLAVEDPAEAAV
jgi:two-component system sensor histidine kinase VicK